MAQPASLPPPPDEPPRGKTGIGGRQIEETLKIELDKGITSLPNQLKYLLALAQVNGQKTATIAYETRSMTISQARLSVLESLVPVLNEKQIRRLLRDIKNIDDLDVRVTLLSKMALYIAPDDFYEIVKEIWQQVDYIQDIVVRTQAMYQIAPLLSLIHDEPATSTPLLNILRVAESLQNTESRLRSLVAIAPHLPYEISLRTFSRVLNELENLNHDNLRVKTLQAMAADVPDDLISQALTIAIKIEIASDRARVLTALAQSMPADFRPRLRQDALDAISTIDNEDDRAEALISFAPHLDYASDNNDKFPAILAKALAIAVGIGRRHIRARVLVAIAPHLTTDLQGEALAAVHSLSNEQERAMLLAELAPNLPPNMLVASLAVAHTMIKQDARVHALTALANYVPASANQQTIRDALAAASNLPHYLERVSALVDLIDLLPPELMEQALSNALDSARSIDNQNAQARALNQLGKYLPENLLHQALDIAFDIENPNQRMNAIIGLVATVADEKRKLEAQEQLFDCAKSIHLDFKQARALVTIIPHLPPSMFAEVELIADGYIDAFDKVNVYLAIAQNSPPENRSSLIAKAWMRLHQIEDGYDRASMIASLAPFLPDRAKKDLAKVIESSIKGISDGYDKASAIRILTPLLSKNGSSAYIPPDMPTALEKGIETAMLIPNQRLRADYLGQGVTIWVNNVDDKARSFDLWKQLVGQLKQLALPDVLLCLGATMPLIKSIADADIIKQVVEVLGIR